MEMTQHQPQKNGELASKSIVSGDAALMQATENEILRQTEKGNPASIMQSAAAVTTNAGLVSGQDISDMVRKQEMSVSETKIGTNRVITESVGGHMVGQFVEPDIPMNSSGMVFQPDAIIIGEALEALAVDQSDAAAIQVAEMRATGRNETVPGGLGATAQSAATRNTRTIPYTHKTTLSQVLMDAKEKLPTDKAVTSEDAEGVIAAELRNKPDCIRSRCSQA